MAFTGNLFYTYLKTSLTTKGLIVYCYLVIICKSNQWIGTHQPEGLLDQQHQLFCQGADVLPWRIEPNAEHTYW